MPNHPFKCVAASLLLLLNACAFEQGRAEEPADPEVGVQAAALSWPLGNVDSVNRHTVDGWACIENYKKPLWAHIYVDGTFRASTVANSIRRPDAAHLCGGRDWHGFSWALPKLSDGSHTVAVYVTTGPQRSTTAKLPGASSVRFPYAWDPAAPGRPYGFVEAITPLEIRGWACDPSVPSTPISVHAYIQYDGVGPLQAISGGATTIDRPDTTDACGGGVKHGFSIPLPVARGGSHNLLVYGIDTAPAGQHNALDEIEGVPNLVSFPYEASDSADPELDYAASCWRGWSAFWEAKENEASTQVWPYHYTAPFHGTSTCPAGVSDWFLSGDGYPFWGVEIPRPEPGYFGPRTRLRYDDLILSDSSLTAGKGWVQKVDTNAWSNPAVQPCHFHFQAIQQNSGGHRPLGADLRFEFTIKVRSEDTFFSDNPDPGGCASRPSAWGYEGFQHVLAALTFSNRVTGKTYFIELVPYWDTHQPNFGGNLPAYQGHGGYGGPVNEATGKDTVTFEGQSYTPAEWLLLRVAVTDPRVAPFISQPARMAPGETRTFHVDLRGLFAASFPVNLFPDTRLDEIDLGGFYIGSEHFNGNTLALEVHRMSIVSRD